MTFTGTDACGNSPKNVFVAEFEEHLFEGDRGALAEAVAEDCVLQIVRPAGVETHTGREAVVDVLLELSAHSPEVGHLEAAITHGKAAAAWGYWQAEADGDDLRHFSHTMWFTTHKAQEFGQIRVFQN
ncbi:hypothetical protein [Brevibacterium spongiae]|uniref:DUF4440 domain-containing protein n=1 Tax=Brevibacterium spongiae TaxID=2909672 RepID=A0ABY5SLP7_9MICO|nr:hypothetical protein [Brevibacterium spongiae]UVI35462.1 hypothetical protein L1F31_15260 [Brevibacterium spongiae]